MEYIKVPKKMLTVQCEEEQHDLRDRAEMIVEYSCAIKFVDKDVFICMMHEPLADQLVDLKEQSKKLNQPVCLVGGQLGLMLCLIPALINAGYAVFEAKTARIAQEKTLSDGSVEKTSKFVYSGLRRLSL